MTIMRVEVNQIYELRQRILRPNGSMESVKFAGDNEKGTEHYALYAENKICGCVSLYEAASKLFFQKKQIQLRGMAVESHFQGKGCGSMLIAAAEKRIREKDVQLVWLNARDYAVGFYEKFGYKCVGEYFDIPDVCKHIVMFKIL